MVNVILKKRLSMELCQAAKCRVRTGHGKPGKSWNLGISFPGLKSHGI